MYLVTYDIEGVIQDKKGGSNLREPVGIPFMWVDIPEGKRLARIDVTAVSHKPVFEDLPKSDIEKLQVKTEQLEGDKSNMSEILVDLLMWKAETGV